MPEKDWNGRLLGTGSGGGGGFLSYSTEALGLRRGYATANTDLGTSPDAGSAVGQPERWADFGHRATHEMTTVAKALVERYYGNAARHSYFVGCSTGGQQALVEAERYPGDYNGIVAGAPANNRTHLHSDFLWNYQATHKTPDSALLPAERITLVSGSAVAACRGRDGGLSTDEFLTDPRACKFDPDTLPRCAQAGDKDCLSSAQLTALKAIYAGPINPRTGERIYAPPPFGSEESSLGIAFQQNLPEVIQHFYPFQWALGADFDPLKFDFDRDLDVVDTKLAAVVNANDPDLNGFRRLGGKLLMFTGTADPIVPFPDTINFYERVVERTSVHDSGTKPSEAEKLNSTQEFFRYFIAPGMAHCGGGRGVNDVGQWLSSDIPLDSDHDLLSALVKWVENGTAPKQIVATAFVDGQASKGVRFERPICAYPKFPEYVSGDPKLPSSFRCANHPRGGVLKPAQRYLR
jgi:feruloyl esterase